MRTAENNFRQRQIETFSSPYRRRHHRTDGSTRGAQLGKDALNPLLCP